MMFPIKVPYKFYDEKIFFHQFKCRLLQMQSELESINVLKMFDVNVNWFVMVISIKI